MKKIKILTSVYNDWKSAFKLLENIDLQVAEWDAEVSILIINDASTDYQPKTELSFKNKTERIITAPLKTAIIEKECIKRLKKLIWEGPKYLLPLMEGIDILSEMIFVTEPEKLLQIHACLTNLAAAAFGKQL